ncbi:hypothetical protein ACFVT2_17480 [Streptomyces sp. NPDC058000]|uniref:hypothetical protein n=1 Tax=Streptomyces sp. NPDC058000 TaxID=3346299 RepID=UPI0036E8041C
MSTVRSRHLANGARRAAITGCLLLAATSAAWLVRDLVLLGRPVDVLTGSLGAAPGTTARRAASVYDAVLAMGGLAAALAVRRGAATAPGALLSLAAATALLRLPLLWTADRRRDRTDAHGRCAGHRTRPTGVRGAPAGGRRGRPATGAGSARRGRGGVRRDPGGAAARAPARRPGQPAPLARGRPGRPSRWSSWPRPPRPPRYAGPLARPAALMTGVLLLGHGGARLAVAGRSGAFGHLIGLPGAAQLSLVAATSVALAGLGGLLAAARPGAPDAPAGERRPVAYGDGPDVARPRHAPPPPSAPPPGW